MAYIGAPYNFVPFPSKVRPYDKDGLPTHDQVTGDAEELISGEITYSITAKTPIFVGSGKKDNKTETFYKNAEGKYAIPGSSVRGMIRSNVQVLSHSSFSDDIDDYKLMYRNVTKNKAKDDQYATVLGADTKNGISILKNVRAGYVKNENGKYRIYDTVLESIDENHGRMNYYILRETKIVEEYRRAKKEGDENSFEFFFEGDNRLQHDLKADNFKFDKLGKNDYYSWVSPTDEKDVLNKQYHPYWEPCSYRAKGYTITAVGASGKYEQKGYVVGTGMMANKKVFYIIPEICEEEDRNFEEIEFPIDLPQEDVRAFKIDLKRRESVLKTVGGKECFDLPENGKMRPVFYIYLDGQWYFGFTPRLRIFYEHTIKDGMTDEQKRKGLDYAKALFGYSDKEGSYKTRLSFADVVVKDAPGRDQEAIFILAEPKPTSNLDYLKPKDEETGQDYNSDDFSLRGMKQYWLRDNDNMEGSNVSEDKKGKEYVQRFVPLKSGTVFSDGKIRFHNLKRDELGLLLWSLRLDQNAEMNLGKGKAFGYGVVSLKLDEVNLFDQKQLCDLEKLSLEPWKSLSESEIDDYIKEYRAGMSAYLGKDVSRDDSIQTFMLMKNVALIPDKKTKPARDKIRPMSIDKKEYQHRTEPLQTPFDVMDLEKKDVEDYLRKEAKTAAQSSMKKGSSYKAKISEVKGKSGIIKFRIPEIDEKGVLKAENIKYAAIEKKKMKEEFENVKQIEVTLENIEEDTEGNVKYIWSCTAKIE